MVRVWDRPIRAFHWLLAFSVTGALVTSLEPSWLSAHLYFGELALCLVVFRLGWGFLGSYYARFESFIKGPKAFWGYLWPLIRLKPPKVLEHNPVASWVFLSMLLLVFGAGVTGLLVLGGQERIGILTDYLSQAQGAQADHYHRWVAYTLLGLICLHLGGASFDSILHKEFLIGALWHGHKEGPEDYAPPENRGRKKGALSFFGISLLATGLFVGLWPHDFRSEETLRALTQPKETPLVAEYKEECGACHFPFSPNLLPRRSWVRMMAELENHFGEDASIDEEEAREILDYLKGGETSQTEAAYYLLADIGPEETPQEISKLPFWKKTHEGIRESVYARKDIGSKINCGACHQYAFYGSFEDEHIAIPEGKKPAAVDRQTGP